MKLYPAWSGSDGLSTVLGPPPFDEAHSYSAHSGQLINSFKSLTDALREQRREFLVVKDLEITAGWNLADGCGMPPVSLVAVGRLNEDGRLGQAFGENLAPDVVETDPASNVPPRHLYRARSIDI